MITDTEYEYLKNNNNVLYYVDTIKDNALRTLVEKSIKEYSTPDKLRMAYDVIDLYIGFLKFKNQIDDNSRPIWVDLCIAAGYMHNMFYDGTVTSLFKAREVISPIAKKLGVPVNAIGLLFSSIEGQFGDKTPVEACIPNEASPNALFAKAVFVVEVYPGHVQLPNGTSY